jgi:hypothetical protein
MSFLNSIQLLFPALIPSWNFFDIISPSPRIQFILLDAKKSALSDWQEFRPRPEKITYIQTLKRMIWNPRWNESLFLVSCAERLINNYTSHSENEILNRIINNYRDETNATYCQFRLIFIHREASKLESKLEEEILFTSRLQEIIKKKNNVS